MSTEITVVNDIIEINVTEEPITIEAPSGAYPLPTGVYSVYGRTGNVVAQEGDYTLTQLAGVTITSPSAGQALVYNGTSWVNNTETYVGTVTSVSATVPTGLTITGSPITTSGTLAFGLQTGYSIPTTASQTTWDTAYNRSLTSAAVTGTTTKTLTLNQQSGGTITASWSDIDTGLTSVGLSMPSAFSVANSPLTANGTLAVTGAGVASQYIRGDGTLANFPTSGGGGSSVAYYFNSSVSQGTLGGVAYRELSKVPIIGAGTDITIATNGYIANYITDAGDPSLLEIPAGNWNFEMYFSASSGGGSPSFYVQLYKYDGTTFTLISSSSATPEGITNGTAIDLYTTDLAVPLTTLTLTDRLAIRVYVNNSGRTITLHTENSHLCEVITTFSTGITALNGLTAQVQYFQVGTSGTDFNISSATSTHTFNIPTASATNRGLLSSADWSTFNAKQSALTNPVTGTGTTNTLPKFTGASAIGDSNITDTGSLITLGSNTTISSGGLGIGTTSLTGYTLRLGANITGATSSYGVSSEGVVQSGVTSNVNYFRTAASTVDSAFTITNLYHYLANQGTFGASSTVTNQVGFFASSNLINGTNIYGFRGLIPSGTNRWNLYMDGTANNYMAGSLGIGSTGLTNISLRIDKNITGAVTSYGIFQSGTIQSDVTTSVVYNSTSANTAAASFTLGSLTYYQALQSTFGAGSSVTTQIGFNVSSNLIGATNNYGFRGSVPSGTNRFNLYMDGTADNYLAGSLGIGSVQVNGGPILTTTLTNGGTGYADGTYTDVALTGGGGQGGLATFVVSGGIVTTATLTWGGANYIVGGLLSASNANLGGTGSGLSITVATVDSSQFSIGSTTGADITLFRNDTTLSVNDSIGTIKWMSNDTTIKASGLVAEIGAFGESTNGGAYLSFLTRSGTAGTSLVEAMRIGGSGGVGIGTVGATLTGYVLRVSKAITGSISSFGIRYDGEIKSDVTTSANLFYTQPTTEATTFTLTSINHFAATQGTFGAGSTITNQYGFIVANSLIGATNNYGFYGNIASGTGRYNLFMNGTAENYLAGNTGIGVSPNYVSSGSILTTTLTNGGSGYVDGTYTDLASSNPTSSGTGALFTVIVSGGIVTTATLTWAGNSYKVGDPLTIPNSSLGGTGSGLVITVATVDSSQLTIVNANGGDITLFRNDTSLSAGENIGTIKWGSNDLSSKASGLFAKIGAFGAGSTGGAYLSFFTRSITAGTSLVEAMRIGDNGSVGIGATTLTGYSLRVSKSITGGINSYGIMSDGTIQSDVTTSARSFMSQPSTAATSFTLPSLYHFFAVNGTLGAGSTITDQFGYFVSSSFTNGTNNYAFYSSLPAGTNRWNLYMNGTAANYMAGQVGIGATSINASAKVQIDSTTQGFLPPVMTTVQKLAIATPAAGLMVYDTTLNQMSYYNGTLWINF